MTSTSIYKDIAQRTGGDIYIGVVGPVRTGKSTFIKKFCETLVIPNAPKDHMRERMIDELPQSAAGRTIMTTEPKFIPERGINISLEGNIELNVRLVDCVGYIVPSSLGYIENDEPRMVKTPWYEDEIPFNMAAEIGTQKVISEHATIGLVITTDASISEIPRDEYEEAEERVINELKEINKPFIVLLNCMFPESHSSVELANELSEKYSVPVIPVNCLDLQEDEIRNILLNVLYEFPVKKVEISLPEWIKNTDDKNDLRQSLTETIREAGENLSRLRQIEDFTAVLSQCEIIEGAKTERIVAGEGKVYVKADIKNEIFYNILSQNADTEIKNDADLFDVIKHYAEIKKKYKKIEDALEQVNSTGYGIVMPTIEEMSLEEPEIMKQGSKYGVRLKASAPSIHMMKADIKTEVAPIVGSEKQSEDLVKYLLDGFEEEPSKIWESNIFGKSLDDLVNEGLKNKLMHMPNEARMKLQQTLERVINEGCSGLICIII